jgi:hypothetical protein
LNAERAAFESRALPVAVRVVEEWWLPANSLKGIGGKYWAVARGISTADEAEMSS